MAKSEPRAEDFIMSLNINGLEGRMLRMPAKRKNQPELLFIYGQHSSLERWFGLALELNKLGAVTMPDMPGFGGMKSLYSIGQTATVDNLADYLAAFIKLKYRNKKFIVLGMSLGFVIVTRMLQKYPELTKKVLLLTSIVGFAHGDDFIFPKKRLRVYKPTARFFSMRLPAWFFQRVVVHPYFLRRTYHKSYNGREKFENMSGDEFERTMDMEILLWKINDIRTQMKTNVEMLSLNNCNARVDLPVHHVAAKRDRYFNNTSVEHHFRQIFSDYRVYWTTAPNHAPTIIATAKEAAPFIPAGIRRLIRAAAEPK